MTSIIKVDDVQDASGNNIINESGDTITIGASGDTITIPSGATITNSGTATGFGGITEADQWRITSNFDTAGGTGADFTANWERTDTDGFGKPGTGLTESSGIFSFPSTGYWLISYNFFGYGDGGAAPWFGVHMQTTLNNSSYDDAVISYGASYVNGAYSACGGQFIFDVTDTANCKFKMRWATQASTDIIFEVSTSSNNSYVTAIRLGDT